MLMSGSRVVISEPQAGRQEAAKQLVIWCGLRYRSLGVKLYVCVVCVSERHADLQVRLLGSSTCIQKAMRLMHPISRDKFRRILNVIWHNYGHSTVIRDLMN